MISKKYAKRKIWCTYNPILQGCFSMANRLRQVCDVDDCCKHVEYVSRPLCEIVFCEKKKTANVKIRHRCTRMAFCKYVLYVISRYVCFCKYVTCLQLNFSLINFLVRKLCRMVENEFHKIDQNIINVMWPTICAKGFEIWTLIKQLLAK